jgi:HK97 family phage portal protein
MQIQTLGLTQPEKLPEKRSSPLDNPAISLSSPTLMWFDNGRMSDAGELINDHSALKISTVFSCVKVLSESVASLPVRLLRITPQGRMQELQDPLHFLLSTAPNPEMTSFVYFETVTFHLVLTGNSYSQIERDGNGTPIALWPLHPRKTRPVRLPNGDLAFETSDGETGSNRRIIPAADVIHIPLTSWNGLVGMSPIEQAARALGLAAGAEKFGSHLFANNATPQIALVTKQVVKPEDKTKMRQDWESLQTGKNQHRVAILDQDMDLKTLSITPDEAQFLETRVHQRSDIAAIFRVPVHMVGSEQKLSNSNVEQINLSFIVDTLRPILTRIEAELVKKLLPPQNGVASTLTIAFDITERQRGDTAAQVSLIAAGRQWGILTANDGRRILGLPVLDSTDDVLMVPVNMMNAERLLDAPKATATPALIQAVQDE